MNNTFKAFSLFACGQAVSADGIYTYNTYWKQTFIGCTVLTILQDMYNFNVSYVLGSPDTHFADVIRLTNDSIDIYVKPMQFRMNILDHARPAAAIFDWRFGFVLRRDNNEYLERFYGLPFSKTVWICIFFQIIISSTIFCYLSYWENHLVGSESCYIYECFLAYSAVCLHILPLKAVLSSRRIAYASFILSAYVIHSFYTSNLLSHLVTDRKVDMSLEELAKSDHQIVLLKEMDIWGGSKLHKMPFDANLTIVLHKLKHLRVMDVIPALNDVMNSNTALLGDYISLCPVFKKLYSPKEVCQLQRIDFYSDVKHFLLTSKTFPYIEEFKVGMLRLKEAGIMKRITNRYECELQCRDEYVIAGEELFVPISILLAAYGFAVMVLLAERIHYNALKLWPYVN